LINFDFNDELNANVPTKKVEGSDEGIFHSIEITEDLFATGDDRLINYKKYYYLAIAYGYNNFKMFDPNDPLLLDGQEKPYISSRQGSKGGIKPVTFIPHPPGAEAGGTVVNASYGDQPEIIRIEGQGNGGLELEISSESIDQILATGKLDFVKYKAGFGPIDVKVIDPLNLPNGDFSLKFVDTTFDAKSGTYWSLELQASANNASKIIWSNRPIGSSDEQLILDWGISVRINDVLHPGVDS